MKNLLFRNIDTLQYTTFATVAYNWVQAGQTVEVIKNCKVIKLWTPKYS